MTAGFVVAATLLALGAAALVAVPLLRSSPAARPARWAALIAVALILAGPALLYPAWSNWTWTSPDEQMTPAAMVGRLARRLERNPDNLDGWLQLGRSYAVMEQYPLAHRAYQRADALTGGRNVDALIGMAEALTLSDEKALDGRAGRLFEQALELDPRSLKALFFSGFVAQRRGDLAAARDRFSRMLALDPPDNVRPIIERQIAALDQQTGAGTAGAAADPPAGGAAASVKLRITLAPGLAATIDGAAPLFVIVRDPARPGPPLAARRLPPTLPVQLELSPRDAMLEGRSFAAGQTVQVVARVARGGTATAQAGDPFGQIDYVVGKDGLREVVIDRVTP